MSTLKACLKRARECLAGADYTEAIQHCRAALQHDDRSYDALVFLGKASFLCGDTAQAEASYRGAISLSRDALPAWKGLAEVYAGTRSVQPEALEIFEQLLQQSEGVESREKRDAYRESLAKCCTANNRSVEALALLRSLPQHTEHHPRILALVADAQATLPGMDVDGLRETLEELQRQTSGNPAYAEYHAQYARCLWEACQSARWDPGACRDALSACKQLCHRATTPDPILICIRLLDISETKSKEDKKTIGTLAAQLAHQFPPSPAAPVALAHALYCQYRACSNAPSTHQERMLILQMFNHGGMQQAGIIHAWLCKARVEHDDRDSAAAKATAAAALAFLESCDGTSPPAPEAVLTELSLILYSSLWKLGDTVGAEQGFAKIAGSARQTQDPITCLHERRAVCSLAACELNNGRTEEALRLYERLLGHQHTKAAANPLAAFEHILGSSAVSVQHPQSDTFPDGEHWVHGEYGWALFTAGRLEEARHQMEIAVNKAEAAGFETPDWEVAQHSWRLGRVLWELGPAHYAGAKQAWTCAVAVDGPCQALAYAWLGLLYKQQLKGAGPARKCFQRALAIDPHLSLAGNGLMGSLRQAGATEAAAELCMDIAEQYPRAAWAQQQLGSLALEQGRAQEAVAALQAALRRDPANAAAWEVLGAAYHMLGRFTAALKAFTRAVELDRSRLYSKVQIGSIHLCLGQYLEAITAFEAALVQSPSYTPACEGAASALLAAARCHQSFGAPGMAADELQRAEDYACAALRGASHKSEAGLKLLGDIKLAHYAVGPSVKHDMLHRHPTAVLMGLFTSWQGRITCVREARRLYARALHMNPGQSSAWGNAASTFYIEAQLRRAHVRLRPEDADALCRASVTCVKGGLRIDPSSADLWACLGACGSTVDQREYALGRALELDPKRAPCWAALGRLYAEAGHTALSDRCLTAARSHDPSSAAAWEAMGTLASLSAEGVDREAYYEEAIKLGGGLEALLGFAEGVCKRGAPSAAAYVAVRRAVEADPLNAAAYNGLGLVAEARSSYAEASEAYELAVQLASPASGSQDAISISTPDKQGHPSLGVSVKLNLARLMSNWQPCRGVELYDQLLSKGHGSSCPETLLAFAHALAGSGQTSKAAEVLHTAAQGASTPQVQLECLQALLRSCIELGDTKGLFSLLDEHQELLLIGPEASLIDLWLTAQAATVIPAFRGYDSELAQRFATWQDMRESGDATFRAKLLVLAGEKAQLSGDERTASQLFARSAHHCPWIPEVWLKAAASKALSDQPSAMTACRIICKFGAPSDVSPDALMACASAVSQIGVKYLADRGPCTAALSKALHLWPAAAVPGVVF